MKTYLPQIERRILVRPNQTFGILNYDLDNAYPQRMLELVASSPTAKDCRNKRSKFIGGTGFEQADLGKAVNQPLNPINQPMTNNSNQIVFATKTSTYVAVKLASGLAVNTATLLFTGDTNASVITDILFRNTDTANARNLDFFIGSTATAENNLVQVSIPANSGNNATTALASLAALAPAVFDLDLAGNRVITIESGVPLYVVNKTALTADIYVRLKTRGF